MNKKTSRNKRVLSVIIVTRNPGNDLHLTLSSLLPLDSEEVEIVVKDNSDKEDLSKINDFYRFRNFRFVHSEDTGIYDAMNQALAISTGEYLYFLNAGDQYYQNDLIPFLKHADPKYYYFYGDFINLYPFPRAVEYTRFMNKYSVYLKCINHQSVIFHKRVFDELGGYDTFLRIESDFLIITEMVNRYPGKKINNYLTIYKGGGISTTYQSSEEQIQYYKEHKNQFYNWLEILFLSAGVRIVKAIVTVKNHAKEKKAKKSNERP